MLFFIVTILAGVLRKNKNLPTAKMANKIITKQPIKMWINGKVFSIHRLDYSKKKAKPKSPVDCTDEEHLKLLDITQQSDKFTTTIKLPKLYYSKMLNLPHFSLDKLSCETETEIIIPQHNHEDGIILNSASTTNLLNAVKHLHSVIAEIRERNVALQFTCIPCQHPEVREKFENLKTQLVKMRDEIEGFDESIFMCPLKLHLTIDVYALLDEKEKIEAISALKDYKKHLDEIVSRSGPLKLDIRTLDCMNANLKKVDVVYANVKIVNETEEYNLQKIVNDISKHFYHRGLAKKYQENVKLHMTIINTKYRKNSESPKRKHRRLSIDATKIMEKFRDYHFGYCNFNSVHLSHITMKGEDGFYKPLAVIKLDENKNTLET